MEWASTYRGAMSRREPVSIVCVFNDPAVLADCLDRSVAALLPTAPRTELITVDNTTGAHASAGAALGHGADRASHDHIAFVHQDVLLHSLVALEEAAGMMADDPGLGVLGCSGIDERGDLHGRMRDRVVLTGRTAPRPTPVDSLDEVLFMVRAEDLRAEPLAQDPELAWHAYAVEYGLRMRARGRVVAAVDIPLTHNSLTVNLDRLEEAHAEVGARYPEALPVRTTCGVIRPAGVDGGAVARMLRPHRWRYRWLRESVMVHRGVSRVGRAVPVLSDIRLDVDDVLGSSPDVTVLNVDDGWFGAGGAGRVTVERRDRRVNLTAATWEEATRALATRAATESLLLTNVTPEQLATADVAGSRPVPLLGYHLEMGYWLLVGPAAARRAPEWATPRAVPALASVRL